ncbi:hypothetical protein BGW38_005986 [Lunasporangiospora selenospora]|uniref:Uncharacterized protein n=1 Tax=Lunasporangiospora selenospora TaxID=979761 RepID=A0A9P6FZ99_9FUNG|nr:hypothetical protein BGW38_005986 [Lunasporangiospora selenospora]
MQWDTEKLVREMQSQMMDIQKRVHVVEELKELESLLGAQNGPAANSNQLSQWQSQIKECQRVLELIIRHPKRENEPVS